VNSGDVGLSSWAFVKLNPNPSMTGRTTKVVIKSSAGEASVQPIRLSSLRFTEVFFFTSTKFTLAPLFLEASVVNVNMDRWGLDL
jgi:hypothetical protein